MATPMKTGSHWALVVAEKAVGLPNRWMARWAVYETEAAAALAEAPGPAFAVVSGTTAAFDSQEAAVARGLSDATRSEAVLSGTYRPD